LKEVEFGGWPAIEYKIACGPNIRRVAGVHRKVTQVLYEACKYPKILPGPCEPFETKVRRRLR
jgi:hypothetical protein